MTIKVRDVMTREVRTVHPDMNLTELDRTLLDAGVSGAPVVDDGRLVGIVSRADVVRVLYDEQVDARKVSDFYTSPFPIAIPALEQLARDSRKMADHMLERRVREVMTPDPRCASPDEDVVAVAKRMSTEGIHRLPVAEGIRLVGIVSSLDIVRLVAEHGLASG